MRGDQIDLQLFIDLGFILLAAFFILTEQSARLQVPMPLEQQPEQIETTQVVYDLNFDAQMQIVLLRQPDQQLFCSANTLEQTQICMRRAGQQAASTLIVLSPIGEATLQQMVSLLDLCLAEQLSCTIAGQN